MRGKGNTVALGTRRITSYQNDHVPVSVVACVNIIVLLWELEGLHHTKMTMCLICANTVARVVGSHMYVICRGKKPD